jgi:hypothetical protein
MVTEAEAMSMIYGVCGLVIGVGIMFVVMLWTNPYMRSKIFSTLTGKSYGCAEFETNNNEIKVRMINMEDDVLGYSKRPDAPRYFNNRSMYRRKFGCPTIHYNYESPNPVSFLDMVRIIKVIPTKVKIMVNDVRTEGKRRIEEVKEYIVGLDQMEILPNIEEKEVEVQDDKGKVYKKIVKDDKTWKVVSSELKNERPVVYTPTKMSDILSHYDARAEILATIQRLKDLANIKNWTLYSMILAGVSVVIGIGILYMISSDIKPVVGASRDTCATMIQLYYQNQTALNASVLRPI